MQARGDWVTRVYQWWMNLPPPVREPIKEVFKVLANSGIVVFATLYGLAASTGHASSVEVFFSYCLSAWWGVVFGLAGPIMMRVREGYLRGINTVALPSGRVVVNTSQPATPSTRQADA